ncbi:probable polygalacturonase [Diospyros lotus]|uniref:probable polygalacturonase n=1 Tax=Diospyros lotus TaxID=55363 RepID=UPI00224EA22D|nr:probable polygalacturonase [Diospyros lotus]
MQFLFVLLSLWVMPLVNKPTRLMKMLAALLFLLLPLSSAVEISGKGSEGQCDYEPNLQPRPHSVSILEFGAVGDGKTLNTLAFQNAVFYLKSFADKGGAQLYVPPGKWLTGSFNLTSHLTLFLAKGATILGSQEFSHWEVVEPLPSYGRGLELPGRRYISLINGYMLHDVVITGDNGTIDGQGWVWWDLFISHSLNYSRPHLVEFVSCKDVVLSNITFLNAPSYNVHPVYCSNAQVHNISIYSPPESPYTVGIVPDSSDKVCIKNCNISTGYDAIALKSGWDEYGIAYGRPTTGVHVKQVHLQASSGSAFAFGSEMSGGISDVLVEHLYIRNSFSGIGLRTTKGRGGYIKDILISDVEMTNVHTAFRASGQSGSHPDDMFDPDALPKLDHITLQNVVGTNITLAGNFTGIEEAPFTSICLSNISLAVTCSSTYWVCSNVLGSSRFVFPKPCPDLSSAFSNSSLSCFSLPNSHSRAAAL